MQSSWFYGLLGGALIGTAASLLLVFAQKTAGISGIFAGALLPGAGRVDRGWRWMFVIGLLLGGVVLSFARPSVFGMPQPGLVTLLGAGVLVGLGTRFSGGCTSGHGVCGLSRLSARSLAATLTFMVAGVITVRLMSDGVLP